MISNGLLCSILIFTLVVQLVQGFTTYVPHKNLSKNLSQPTSPTRASSSRRRSRFQLFAIRYTVQLGLPPLGIVFEERDPGAFNGVVVTALSTGGRGERCGKIEIGDYLTKTTAVQIEPGTSKYALITVDATRLDFDSVVSAIGSHQVSSVSELQRQAKHHELHAPLVKQSKSLLPLTHRFAPR